MQRQCFSGLVEIDRACGTELLTRFAFAILEVDAVVVIDHRELRHGLCERSIDGLAITQPRFVNVIHHFLGTFILAGAATVAEFGVYVARLLLHAHRKVAYVTFDMSDFTIG